MTKAKPADDTFASAETTAENGAAALKTGLEKALKNYDAVLGFGKETSEAYVKSATVAGKGFESLNNEVYAYSRQSVEDTISAARAVMGSKSVHEALTLQTDFAKAAFEAYVGQLGKVGELVASTAEDAYAPLKGRVQAWFDVVQASRA